MSGAANTHVTSKKGSTGALTVYFPFVPGVVNLYVENAGATATVHGIKTYKMGTDTYLASGSGWDTGVTINVSTKSITIAAGADVNVNGKVIHIVAEDNYQAE